MKNFAIKYGKIIHMISVPVFIILGVGLSFLYKTPYFIFSFISVMLLIGLSTYIEIIWYNNKTEIYYNIKLTKEEIEDIIGALENADKDVQEWAEDGITSNPLINKFKNIIKEDL